ncbi:uncharacterized protein LOC121420733 [Lytechinus variegatus]|uniref:uncharacterized protein LOC121420733 n=1 Tax=Lytechinus variegatus TaxID=7654 RepID=UPI001BB19CAA|nr:uncharacterized protein LOC121420733 [Lytechinus variegatus]
MKYFIGLFLLSCLCFEIGHALKCYTCGSFKYQTVDAGNCGDALSEVECEVNKTRCAEVELGGNLVGSTTEKFTFSLRGCTEVEATTSEAGCTSESDKANEIIADVGFVDGGYGNAQFQLFKQLAGDTYADVDACTCSEDNCNSAGFIQASVAIVCASLVMSTLVGFL